MIHDVQKVSDGSMVFTSRRSFDCGIIQQDGTIKDTHIQEGDTFGLIGLLYDDVTDTYDFELKDGTKIENIPGMWVGN